MKKLLFVFFEIYIVGKQSYIDHRSQPYPPTHIHTSTQVSPFCSFPCVTRKMKRGIIRSRKLIKDGSMYI